MTSCTVTRIVKNNELIYTLTGKKFVPKILENKTKGTEINDVQTAAKDGICRNYSGKTEQTFSQNIFGKYEHPDYDAVSFYFSRGNGEPVIGFTDGKLYKDGTFTTSDTIDVGERIDSKGNKEVLSRKMTVNEAEKLVEQFRSIFDELTPKIRRVISKIKKVEVV